MPNTTTNVSRLKLVHPDIGYEGGVALHTFIRNGWTKLGDNINSRFFVKTDLADSASQDFEHNFLCDFSELNVLLYAYDEITSELTRITQGGTPDRDDFTIEATPAAEKSQLRVTNNTGSTQDIAIVVVQGRGAEKLNDLDDVDVQTTPPEDGQALVWDGVNFIPGASGDSSLKLQAISGTDLVIKSGYMLLSDGRELRLASDMTYDLSGIVDNGSYYVYIDLSLLPAASYLFGRKVYALTSAMITLLENTADQVSNSSLAYLGTIQRASGVWVNQQTGAFRRHDLSTGDVKGATYTLTATQVDALMPLTHTLAVPPELSLKVFDGTDYEYHDAGAYFKSSTTQIKSNGTTLASVLGGATTVIFSYAAGTPTTFVPNSFWKTKVVAANDAVLANDQIFANTSGGAITLLLPLAPSIGDSFRVLDFDGSWDATNKVTLDGNGEDIMGAATYELTIADSSEELVYNGVEWRVV